jgi:hypothetical protein
MNEYNTKLPMSNDCCGAKATRKPWRSKGSKDRSHIKKATNPGDVVAIDQLESNDRKFDQIMNSRKYNLCRSCLRPKLYLSSNFNDFRRCRGMFQYTNVLCSK